MIRLVVPGLLLVCAAAMSAQQPGKDKKPPAQQPGKDKGKKPPAQPPGKDKGKKPPAQPPGKDKQPPALPPVNPATAKLEATFSDLPGPAFDLAAGGANDNQLVAVACEQDVIAVFRKDALRDAKAAKPQLWKGHHGPVVALAYNGGPVLASAGADKKIIFWKAPEGKILHTVPAPAPVHCLAMSSDGKWLASGGEDSAVHLWEVAGAKPAAKLTGHKDWVLCLAFSPDGKHLAAGAIDGTIRLWDVPGGKKIADLPHKAPVPPKTVPPAPIPVRSLAFAPDGKALLYGAADGPIHIINPADGKTIRTLTGHTGAVTAIRFHPSGNLLATASKDRTVMLWNPASPSRSRSSRGTPRGSRGWRSSIGANGSRRRARTGRCASGNWRTRRRRSDGHPHARRRQAAGCGPAEPRCLSAAGVSCHQAGSISADIDPLQRSTSGSGP